jgi:hypothetical protein
MPSECPDLKQLSNGRFKIEYDPAVCRVLPSGRVRPPIGAPKHDPWNYVIPCQVAGAEIWPYGSGLLGVDLFSGLSKNTKRVLALKGARLHTRGQKEYTVVVPERHFGSVIEILKPRKKRQYTEEQRAEAKKRFEARRIKSELEDETEWQRLVAANRGNSGPIPPKTTSERPGAPRIDPKPPRRGGGQ